MEDLEFEEGRAVVKLDDEHWLSILNTDRTAVLQEARQDAFNSMYWGSPFTDAQAGEGTYEVAVLTGEEERSRQDIIDPTWEQYLYRDGSWLLYRFVPFAVIEALVDGWSRD